MRLTLVLRVKDRWPNQRRELCSIFKRGCLLPDSSSLPLWVHRSGTVRDFKRSQNSSCLYEISCFVPARLKSDRGLGRPSGCQTCPFISLHLLCYTSNSTCHRLGRQLWYLNQGTCAFLCLRWLKGKGQKLLESQVSYLGLTVYQDHLLMQKNRARGLSYMDSVAAERLFVWLTRRRLMVVLRCAMTKLTCLQIVLQCCLGQNELWRNEGQMFEETWFRNTFSYVGCLSPCVGCCSSGRITQISSFDTDKYISYSMTPWL